MVQPQKIKIQINLPSGSLCTGSDLMLAHKQSKKMSSVDLIRRLEKAASQQAFSPLNDFEK